LVNDYLGQLLARNDKAAQDAMKIYRQEITKNTGATANRPLTKAARAHEDHAAEMACNLEFAKFGKTVQTDLVDRQMHYMLTLYAVMEESLTSLKGAFTQDASPEGRLPPAMQLFDAHRQDARCFHLLSRTYEQMKDLNGDLLQIVNPSLLQWNSDEQLWVGEELHMAFDAAASGGKPTNRPTHDLLLEACHPHMHNWPFHVLGYPRMVMDDSHGTSLHLLGPQ
jgi:hypothetical protein